jgi:hypothetical protein
MVRPSQPPPGHLDAIGQIEMEAAKGRNAFELNRL